jgi:large conductance mechanosensitive channel
MRRLWNEFKSFAMSGNMLDLALGFIIGAAFATLVESLADNVLMQFVAAIFGTPDFGTLYFKVNEAKIEYGAFLTDIINFLMLAAVLFLIIKFIVFLGVGRERAFGTQQCPYCREQIAPSAIVCKFCRQPLVDELPSLADARAQMEEQNRRKIGLPVPIPGRRKGATPQQAAAGGSGPEEGRDRS